MGLKEPRNILRQHAYEEARPDVEGRMSGENKARSAHNTRQHECDGDIQSRSKLIMEAEEEKEHQGAAHGDGVHAYFVKDIADPAATDGKEGAKEKMNGRGRNFRQVFKNVPGPPVKGHGYDVWDHPVLFGAKHHGIDEAEPPHQENREGRQEGTAEDDIEKSEHFCLMVEGGEGVWMKKDQEGHHIRVDEQRMKNIGDQVCAPP